MEITKNLNRTRAEISVAEKQFQCEQGTVNLLAVSKTRTVNEIMTAYTAAQRHFGENYCQEAITKIKAIENNDIVWHFIGPIQSNKTRLIAEHFNWVHTVERLKIAHRLNEGRANHAFPLNICVQVNISKEASKSGIDIDSVENFIDELSQFERLSVRGLMALPAPSEDFDTQKSAFSKLHEKFRILKRTYPDFDTLSMGTSRDMLAAISAGATIVRIGSAIFGPRKNN